MGPSYHGTRGVPWPPLFRRIGQQGQLSGAFDGRGQDALVRRTVSGDTAGENLAALRDEPAQTVDILVVNGICVLAAECAVPALGPPPTPLSPALRPRPAVRHCLSPSRITMAPPEPQFRMAHRLRVRMLRPLLSPEQPALPPPQVQGLCDRGIGRRRRPPRPPSASDRPAFRRSGSAAAPLWPLTALC